MRARHDGRPDTRQKLNVEDLLDARMKLQKCHLPAGDQVHDGDSALERLTVTAIGKPPNVDVSRIRERPTNAKVSIIASPLV